MSEFTDEFPADITDLAEAVHYLAATVSRHSDADLGQPYRWHAHNEGVRFALIGSLHELRALAVRLAAARRAAGPPTTTAHHILAQFNAAYRDLCALLVGVTEEEYDARPTPGEWSLRYVVGHIAAVQRHFFALVHYGLERARAADDRPVKLPDGETDRIVGPYADFSAIMDRGSLVDMLVFLGGLRRRAFEEFAGISDDELEARSTWWEGEAYTLAYRLHRFEAHLRQHIAQAEKALDALGRPPTEASRLTRAVYAALAEVEAATIGAPDLGYDERCDMAETITGRAELAAAAVQSAHEIVAAVSAGDDALVRQMLDEQPALVNATDQQGVPLVRHALYYGHGLLADYIASVGAELDLYDAAALGRAAVVEQQLGEMPWLLYDFSRDGYTALQLACFFGHDDIAQLLIARGADVNAHSRNPRHIQPLHAAAAGRSPAIVGALLAAGADPNGVQQDGLRPLHAAAQNGDTTMVGLLVGAGADPALTNDAGETPRSLAERAGHAAVVAML